MVQGVRLDGEPLRNWWIDWDQLAKAKELVFTMTDTPNMDAAELPPSFPASKQVVQ